MSLPLGLIGYGTVGQGVVDVLERLRGVSARPEGVPEVRAVLVRNTDRRRDVPPPAGAVLTDDPDELFASGPAIVAEVAGGLGVEPLLVRALETGADVVTANKALLAERGPELFARAESCGRRIAIEAAVAGGIPIIAALTEGLAADRPRAIAGVLNGTCTYILSRLAEDRDGPVGYHEALAEAQRLGYAEADPTLDVSGADAAQKLAILSTLAFGRVARAEEIPCTGVDGVEPRDARFARQFGCAVRLVATARAPATADGPAHLSVAPTLVPADDPLARVAGSFNAAAIFSEAAGLTYLTGHGAGRYPTASAVASDIVTTARRRLLAGDERARGTSRASGAEGRRGAAVNPWPVGAAPLALAPGDPGRPARFYVRLHLLHHDMGYAALRARLAAEGVPIDRLHETDRAMALLTGVTSRGAVDRALAGEIADAIDEPRTLVLPVFEGLDRLADDLAPAGGGG